VIDNNPYNFGVAGSVMSCFIQNIDNTNLVNGKPVVYLTGNENLVINQDNVFGYLGLVQCDNIRVENLLFENNINGILLAGTENSFLENNIYRKNEHGIHLFFSDNNFIENSTVENNFNGIYLDNSENNELVNNYIKSSANVGVYLVGSSLNNVVHYNDIFGNENYGARNDNENITLLAENNWWGSSTGPGGVGPGAGDNVSENVDYDPWRITPFAGGWYLLDDWTGTVSVTTSTWHAIESWAGTVSTVAPAWTLAESWSGTVSTVALTWKSIESWSEIVEAPYVWVIIESWSGTVSTTAAWTNIESWSGTVSTVTSVWTAIESWSGTVSVPSSVWTVVETRSGSVSVTTSAWQSIESRSGSANAIITYYVSVFGNDANCGLSWASAKKKIDNAIKTAFAGDTIIVGDGTYPENLNVNKSLTIRSENGPAATIVKISDNNYNHVFEVTDNNVTIAGFTVKNATGSFMAGVYLNSADNCRVENNIVENNRCGIQLYESDNNTVANNTCKNNVSGGVVLEYSDNNVLENNVSENHRGGIGIGIYVSSSDNNTLENNLSRNNDYGIMVFYSTNDNLSNNRCENNTYNFGVATVPAGGDNISHFIHNIDNSNLVNGKPVVYLIGENNITINQDNEFGYLGLVNGENVIIENMVLENNFSGLVLAGVRNSLVENITARNNYIGVYLSGSDNSTVGGSTGGNNYYGIYLSSSDNGIVSGNAADNNYYGVSLWSSDNNIFSGNTIENNHYGIYLSNSDNNRLTNNTCENSGTCGIYFTLSANNTLENNTLVNDNTFGVPNISSVASSGITQSSATVTWTTAESSDSTVEYGTTTSYGAISSDATMTMSHSVSLPGLSAATTYHYRVKSADADNNTDVSLDYTFTTSSPPPPPSAPDFAVSLSQSSGTIQQGNSVTVTVSVAPSSSYSYSVALGASGAPSGVLIGFSPGSGTPSFSSTMTITVGSSVTPGVYTIAVKGTGGDGKIHSANYSLTVSQLPFQPPVSKVNDISLWQTSASFTITAAASDNNGSVASVSLYYRYSGSGSSWGPWVLFGLDTAAPWSWSFSADNNGYYQFYSVAKGSDNIEEQSPASADAQCGVDTAAPGITLFKINSDNSSTSSSGVVLAIGAQDATSGLDVMRFSDDGTGWSSWETFGTSRSYTLQGLAGTKTVYLMVRDKAGLTSTASDSIMLENVTWSESVPEIAENENGSLDFTSYNIPTTKIIIVANGTVSNLVLNVGVLSGKPENVPAPTVIVARYLEIKTQTSGENIDHAVIEFKLEKSWITANNIDENTVQLMRYKNGWQPLPTRKIREDVNYVYYSAETPGFSVFAIGGSAQMPTVPTVTALPLGILAFAGLGLLVAMVAVIWVFIRRGGKRVATVKAPPKEIPKEPPEPKEPAIEPQEPKEPQEQKEPPKEPQEPKEPPKEPKAPAPSPPPKSKDDWSW